MASDRFPTGRLLPLGRALAAPLASVLALTLLAAPARAQRTSPFEPPKANDITFVRDSAGGLDTSCTYRSGGPLTFEILVTRHAGALNPDGTLRDAAALVAAGLLSPTATLSLPVFDVDSSADVEPPTQPERDRVSFNGEVLGFLTGENGQWKLSTFQVPIEKVRFAARAANGSAPAGAANEVRIDIDTANSSEVWCMSVDWGALTFKAMSPVVLIHGNNSDGGFYARMGFTTGLDTARLLFDNSISMTTASRAAHGVVLDGLLPGIVKSFGVDSCHVVVHSKGGLDTREYLAVHHPARAKDFQVLSYTSLSTPHEGTSGADLLVMKSMAVQAKADKIEFVGFPWLVETVAEDMGVDAGTPDLTTRANARFNAVNIPMLPRSTVYNTVAADADTNGNGEIDRSPDEYLHLRTESAELTTLDNSFGGNTKSRWVADALYQTGRLVSTVQLRYRVDSSFLFGSKVVAILTAVPTAAPVGNDALVGLPSGQGASSLAALTTNTTTFTGAAGRNHSNVADAGVAATVVPWIVQVERTSGDLR